MRMAERGRYSSPDVVCKHCGCRAEGLTADEAATVLIADGAACSPRRVCQWMHGAQWASFPGKSLLRPAG